jgi:hypothetical protein
VDGVVEEAIRDWERERPQQAPMVDETTGEMVHYLFACRNQQIGLRYLNKHLIPALCRKTTSDLYDDLTFLRAYQPKFYTPAVLDGLAATNPMKRRSDQPMQKSNSEAEKFDDCRANASLFLPRRDSEERQGMEIHASARPAFSR